MATLRLIIEIRHVTPEGSLHAAHHRTVEVEVPDWVAQTLSQLGYSMASVVGAEVIAPATENRP